MPAITAKHRHDYTPPAYTITDIDLIFALDAQQTTVMATSQVKRLSQNPATALVLDGEALTLLEIKVNNQTWNYYQQSERALVIENLPAEFSLTIITLISPATNSALEGLYCSDNALCTQCEAEGFRRITFYLDRPDVLATFSTTLIGNQGQYPTLLSNGNRIAQGAGKNGDHWVRWHDPFPKPCYLFALVAGDFEKLHDTFITKSNRTVALELYVEKGNLARANWAMESLKRAMRWDEQRFGLEYDLDIYMIVAVDFFNMGAMENKGLNIFNAKFVLADQQSATDEDYLNIESVIAHEYFHNWTGNRVTCRDWFQLSLKEGLTVFRDQEFSSDLGSRAVERIKQVRTLRTVQFAEDAGPFSHPIRPEKVLEMNNFYTITVYEKGAEVIRMMHTLLGEAAFQAGMRTYFARHDGCAVTCDDFVQAMEDSSGIDLSLFRRWYSQSGTPQLTLSDHYDEKTGCYQLEVAQFTPPTADQVDKEALYIPLIIALYDQKSGAAIALKTAQGESISPLLHITQWQQTFSFYQIASCPTPALLCGFSAPVKLHFPYTEQQLQQLLQHGEDPVVRWDAMQILVKNHLLENIARYQQQQTLLAPTSIITAFRNLMMQNDQLAADPALLAEMLTLPTIREIVEWFNTIDIDAIFYFHTQLQQQLAQALTPELQLLYQANKALCYEIKHQAIGKRALRNICLHYLAFSDEKEVISTLLLQHYQQANNMTDMMAALHAAVMAQYDCQQSMLSDFANRFHPNSLAMQKWFAVQALSPATTVLHTVKHLMHHASFSFSNPNCLRALIGNFASNNLPAFHAVDGSGYQFLTEILCQLNTQNPQVASRLIEPLLQLRRFDKNRQSLMQHALEKLFVLPNLSADLYEKVNKALHH